MSRLLKLILILSFNKEFNANIAEIKASYTQVAKRLTEVVNELKSNNTIN